MPATPKKCTVQSVTRRQEGFEAHTAEWSQLCEEAASADHKMAMLWKDKPTEMAKGPLCHGL